MKKKQNYLLVILLFSGLISYAQDISFTGTADKKYDGNQIVIYNRAEGVHDSAVIKDGKFVITVPFKEPAVFMFYSELERKTTGGYSPYGIMVTEPGTIKINADV